MTLRGRRLVPAARAAQLAVTRWPSAGSQHCLAAFALEVRV